MLQVKRRDQVTFLHSEFLGRIPRIVHAFSTRRGERSDFSLGPVSSPNPMIQINRVRFLAAIEAPGWPLLKLQQMHSGVVIDMTDTSSAGDAAEGDAAITALEGVVVGVHTADCVPILVADMSARAVAAIHAGWRGTSARIVESAVRRFQENYRIEAKDLVVVAGPHIGVCCYEVGNDVVEAIQDPRVFERRADWAKPHLNLAEAIRRQLTDAGVADERIEISSLCTRCREDLFHSYRRDGKRTGQMLSVIGIAT